MDNRLPTRSGKQICEHLYEREVAHGAEIADVLTEEAIDMVFLPASMRAGGVP